MEIKEDKVVYLAIGICLFLIGSLIVLSYGIESKLSFLLGAMSFIIGRSFAKYFDND